MTTAQAAADAREIEINRERQAANAASGRRAGHLGGAYGHLGGSAENGAFGHLGGAFGHLGGHLNQHEVPRVIQQLDPDTGEMIDGFPSVSAASKAVGLAPDGGMIGKVLNGTKKSAGGFKWRRIFLRVADDAPPQPQPQPPSPLDEALVVIDSPPPPSPLQPSSFIVDLTGDDDAPPTVPPPLPASSPRAILSKGKLKRARA